MLTIVFFLFPASYAHVIFTENHFSDQVVKQFLPPAVTGKGKSIL